MDPINISRHQQAWLYVCTTYRIGSDLQVCIDDESLLPPEEPVIPENPTAQQKMLWGHVLLQF